MKKLSIITPCYNEEVNVEICAFELKKVMKEKLPEYDYEHIFSDNASEDSTLEKLRVIASKDFHIKVISNSRNVGPFRNMWNAMKSATGDAVVPLLPADLQDPPSIIPEFVRKWESGYLVIYGVRTNRQESFFMRMLRGIYYRVIKRFASAVIPLNSGEFLLADKKVVESVLSVDDQYPYIRGLIAQTGVKSSSVSYTWVKRERGKSKNNFIALIDQAINGFVSTSRTPARLALLGGFTLAILGFIYGLLTIFLAINSEGRAPVGIPTIIIGIFLLGGIQLFFLGLIGEYVLSVHGQVRRTPPMFEIERINFEQDHGK
jgi:glycosyltransferase involved in cell wall biosynthesis